MRVLKSVSMIWFGSILGAALSFLMQALIAQKLTVDEFGYFSSSYAMVGLLVPIAGFGVAQYWFKVFGQYGKSAIVYIKPSLKLLLINAFFICLMLIFWAGVERNNAFSGYVISFLFIHLIGQVLLEVISTRYQLEENYSLIFYIQCMPHLLRILVLISLMYILSGNISPAFVALAYAVAAIFIMVFTIKPLKGFILGDFTLSGHKWNALDLIKVDTRTIYKESWPFAFATLFHLIYFQSDIILLKYLKGDQDAGYYSISFMILAAILIFPSVVYQKVLMPRLHRWAHSEHKKFYSVYKIGNITMAVVGIICMLITWLLSPFFIPLFFGEKYDSSIELLNITAISIPLLYIASSVGAVLATKENMRIKVKVMFVVAVINISLNVIFIPVYGATGAAITTVISNFLLLTGYFFVAKKFVFK